MSRYFWVSIHSNFELYFKTPFFPAVFLHQFYHSNRWTLHELRHILRKAASTKYFGTMYKYKYKVPWLFSLQTAMAVSHLSLTFRQLSLRPSAVVQGNLTRGMCCCNLWVARVGTKGKLGVCFSLCVVGRVGATEIREKLPCWVMRHRQDPLAFQTPHRGLWVQLDPASVPDPVNGLC